ncbi:substrate-binding domain-containing protein [Streptosporangium amethystogenes]|uniref:substrate-binding domain-containing protein n=1 Tax=Streptosporangium amethystogenes TaxID=2002 RepID=UPI00055DC762|nr:substrate-binding domain-containing protein [Streptosporangium amethystogenes]
MRVSSSIAAFAALSALLVGCTAETAGKAEAGGTATERANGVSVDLMADKETLVDTSAYVKDGPYTIASIMQGPINGWGLTLDTTIEYLAAQEKDIEKLTVVPVNGDVDRQISAMENTIKLKPDLIMLEPLSAAALSASVSRAVKAGIPVVVCADGVEGKPYTAYADVDLYRAGYESAKALAKELGGKGKIIMISGIPGVDAAEVWKKAAEDVFATYPDIKIVASEYGNWSIPTSKDKATAMLAANPEIDGVYAGGSEGAIGALLAFDEAGRTQPVFGTVSPLNGWLRLAIEHKVKFTAWPQPAALEGKYCVDTALKVLRGEKVTKFVHIPEEVITEKNAAENYIPELNDDFSVPAVAPIDVYVKAGFGRK